MSTYQIQPYSYKQAEKLGVLIVPSDNSKKKIDVYNKYGLYMCSIGQQPYKDYPTYLEQYGKEYAENRRRLYKIRHNKDRVIEGSAGYYSDNILW